MSDSVLMIKANYRRNLFALQARACHLPLVVNKDRRARSGQTAARPETCRLFVFEVSITVKAGFELCKELRL